MPLQENDISEVRVRLKSLLNEILHILEMLNEYAPEHFPERYEKLQAAFNEFRDDFVGLTDAHGNNKLTKFIDSAEGLELQNAGLYGAQLDIKEEYTKQANQGMLQTINQRVTGRLFRRKLTYWTKIINRFLGSLLKATAIPDALKELKELLESEVDEQSESS